MDHHCMKLCQQEKCYFNQLTRFEVGNYHGCEIYFNDDGTGDLLNGVTPNPTFTWTPGVWKSANLL